jgi:hypothetical protein
VHRDDECGYHCYRHLHPAVHAHSDCSELGRPQ